MIKKNLGGKGAPLDPLLAILVLCPQGAGVQFAKSRFMDVEAMGSSGMQS